MCYCCYRGWERKKEGWLVVGESEESWVACVVGQTMVHSVFNEWRIRLIK